MEKLIGFITVFDAFGKGLQLKLDKQVKSKTCIGGCLSILMLIVVLAFFLITAQDVFMKTNPLISIEQQILPEYPNITLDSFNMPLVISLTGLDSIGIYEPSLFEYKFKRVYGDLSTELIEQELELEFCKLENFPMWEKETFENSGMGTMFCVKNQNVTLSGSWGEASISYLSVTFGLCLNRTEDGMNGPCAPQEVITKYIQENVLYWNLYFINSYINPQNSSAPISISLVNLYKLVVMDKRKAFDIYFRKQSLNSDGGFIFKSRELNHTIALDYSEYDDQSFKDDGILVEVSIMGSNNYYIYHRTYLKIQSVLANVGGLTNVLKMLFIMICSIFSTVKRDLVILNRIFEYDTNNKRKPTDLPSSPTFIPKRTTVNNTQIFETNIRENWKKQQEQNVITFFNINKDRNPLSSHSTQSARSAHSVNKKTVFSLNHDLSFSSIEKPYSTRIETGTRKSVMNFLSEKKKKYKIQFSFCDIIIAFLCCNKCANSKLKVRKLLYDKSNFVVDQYLDIIHIIQKLDEFEKLKIILLSEEQFSVFKFVSKELISVNQEKSKFREINKYREFANDEEKILYSLCNFLIRMSKNTNINDLDKRLFALLDEEFKIDDLKRITRKSQ